MQDVSKFARYLEGFADVLLDKRDPAAAATTYCSSLRARGVVSRYFDRVRTPAETLAALRPRLAEFGVTRLARLTGLDEIGVPVWAAIRPNALTLAVSQGKGVADDAAAASAMMEAIEVATAERRDLPRLTLIAAGDGGSRATHGAADRTAAGRRFAAGRRRADRLDRRPRR